MPSTAIGKIEYDEQTQRLFVTFVTNGRRYAYLDVPFAAYEAFRHAFSKGTHFNAHIRDRYEHTLIYDPKAAASPTSATMPKHNPRTVTRG